MERRQYVATLGTLTVTGLAGCGDNSSDETPTETPTETTTPPSDDPEDWQETYRSALEQNDIDVDFIDVNEQRLVLDYNTQTTERAAFLRELEVVATTYSNVVAETWDIESAELWAIDPEIEQAGEDALASALVQNEWAFAHQNDELTTNEFMNNVVDTLELYEPFRDRYGEETSTPTETDDTTNSSE